MIHICFKNSVDYIAADQLISAANVRIELWWSILIGSMVYSSSPGMSSVFTSFGQLLVASLRWLKCYFDKTCLNVSLVFKMCKSGKVCRRAQNLSHVPKI